MAARQTQETRPISQWNIDALDSLKGTLKLKVSMSAGLRDKLPIAAKGFLNAEEVQQVTKLRSDDEQINEVIEILKKKTDKDFQTFLGLLRRTNQEVWASELEGKAEEFKQSSKSPSPSTAFRVIPEHSGPIYVSPEDKEEDSEAEDTTGPCASPKDKEKDSEAEDTTGPSSLDHQYDKKEETKPRSADGLSFTSPKDKEKDSEAEDTTGSSSLDHDKKEETKPRSADGTSPRRTCWPEGAIYIIMPIFLGILLFGIVMAYYMGYIDWRTMVSAVVAVGVCICTWLLWLRSKEGTTIAFALITANSTEQKIVRHFFKLGDAGQVWEEAEDCNYTTDFYLKKEKLQVEYLGTHSDSANEYEFEVFTFSSGKDQVIGIHVKCLQQASFAKGGSQKTTTALLKYAKERNWRLQYIFSVGCCGFSAEDKSKANAHEVMGQVLLSNVYKDYSARGKVEITGLKFHSQFYEGARDWVSRLEDHSITRPGQQADRRKKFRIIPVAEVPLYASGSFVIKTAECGNMVRGEAKTIGIEMEASGIASALDQWVDITGQKAHVPKFLLLKGVSDVGSNKGKRVKALFFGKPTAEEVSDDERQEIATFHCVALVARGVAKKFLCSKKFV